MNKTLTLASGLLIVAALFIGLQPPAAAQKQGKTRPLTTSQMMAGLVKPQLVALQEGLKKTPASEDDWKALATSAALLNESSYMLMEDGRCPDKPWKDGSMILREATVALLGDIASQDAEAATAKIESVIQSCKVCHAEHKYKKKQP